jgi:ketosteroid isomerase-like protein
MSQPELQILVGGYAAFNRGDWTGVFRAADPEIELKTADRVTSPGTYRGREQIIQFFEDFFGAFDEVLAEPEQYFVADDRIVVFVHVRSRPKGSSAWVENRVGHLWTFRDGKVLRFEIFPERNRALEAVGLPEPGAASRT